MNIEEALDTIKQEALKELKKEFADLLKTATRDEQEFIRTSAERIKDMLVERAEGKLTERDVKAELKNEKRIAQIEANRATIEVLSRIQKITYRLLDIAIDGLVKAMVPIA